MTFEEDIRKFTSDIVTSDRLNNRLDVFFGRGSPPTNEEEYEKLPLTFLNILLSVIKEKGYLLAYYSFELETGKYVFEYTTQS